MRSSISENARLKNQLMRADDAATSPKHPNTATSTSVLTALLVTSRYPAYSNSRNETAVSTSSTSSEHMNIFSNRQTGLRAESLSTLISILSHTHNGKENY